MSPTAPTPRREAGGGWTAPDLERARSLVPDSGRAGERVVVRVPHFQRRVGRYFTGLLGDLGFRASLRVLPDGTYFGVVQDAGSRAQMGFNGWAPDYLTPSNFIELNFACASRADPVTLNESRLCDRALTLQITRALAAPPAEAGQLWAAVDRR